MQRSFQAVGKAGIRALRREEECPVAECVGDEMKPERQPAPGHAGPLLVRIRSLDLLV